MEEDKKMQEFVLNMKTNKYTAKKV